MKNPQFLNTPGPLVLSPASSSVSWLRGDILEKVLLQPQRRVRPLLFAPLPWKLVLCSTLPTWAYMFIYNEQVGCNPSQVAQW